MTMLQIIENQLKLRAPGVSRIVSPITPTCNDAELQVPRRVRVGTSICANLPYGC